MKKCTTMMLVAMMMSLPTLLTSCNSDPWYDDPWYDDWSWGNDYNHRPDNENVSNDDFFVLMAQTLAGQWRGNMMAYEIDDHGYAIDSLFYITDIEFKQYNRQSISGTGTQYDFHPDTEKLEMKRDFTWYIDPQTGDIYLIYKEQNADGTTRNYTMCVAYDDLNMNNRTFTGYLWAEDGREVDDFWFDRYNGTRASIKQGARKIKVVFR